MLLVELVALLNEYSITSSTALLLLVVLAYAVATATVLPLPSEAVLTIALFLPFPLVVSLAVVILVSALGKAAGSLIALRIGYGVSRSGPVVRFYERFPRYRWFKRDWLATFVSRYQYLGLTLAMSIPILPETTILYAFSVLENERKLFVIAVVIGSIVRLCIAVLVVGSVVLLG